MTLEEAQRIYQENLDSAAKFIADISSNNDSVLINSAITNSYLELAKNDPLCAWFSLGTLVSSVVGQNIHFSSVTNTHTAGKVDPAVTVVSAFSKGNQDIFKSIVPLYKTYKQIGPEGVNLLVELKDQNKTPFGKDYIIDAFKAYEE